MMNAIKSLLLTLTAMSTSSMVSTREDSGSVLSLSLTLSLTPSPHGATPPHPGAGRETHSENPPQGGWFFHNLPNFPYGKGGFDVSGGGG
jgi:hypothetical protein